MVCNLIANAPSVTSWKVLCYETPTPKKTKNHGQSYAPKLTILSDLEEEQKDQSNSGKTKSEGKDSPGKKMKTKDPIKDSKKCLANKGLDTKTASAKECTVF